MGAWDYSVIDWEFVTDLKVDHYLNWSHLMNLLAEVKALKAAYLTTGNCDQLWSWIGIRDYLVLVWEFVLIWISILFCMWSHPTSPLARIKALMAADLEIDCGSSLSIQIQCYLMTDLFSRDRNPDCGRYLSILTHSPSGMRSGDWFCVSCRLEWVICLTFDWIRFDWLSVNHLPAW